MELDDLDSTSSYLMSATHSKIWKPAWSISLCCFTGASSTFLTLMASPSRRFDTSSLSLPISAVGTQFGKKRGFGRNRAAIFRFWLLRLAAIIFSSKYSLELLRWTDSFELGALESCSRQGGTTNGNKSSITGPGSVFIPNVSVPATHTGHRGD